MADPANPTPPPATPPPAPAAATAAARPAAPKPTFKVTRSPFAPKIQGMGAPPPPPPSAPAAAVPSAAASSPSVPILSIGGVDALSEKEDAAPAALPRPASAAAAARARASAAPVARRLERGPDLKTSTRVGPVAFVVDLVAAAGAIGIAVLMLLEFMKLNQ